VSSSWYVDASMMRTMPAASTDLPTIMVAERIATWLAGGRARQQPRGHLARQHVVGNDHIAKEGSL
jgi:choline dehydrogenase-like flavoprotein